MSEQQNELPAVARNINLACKKCETDRYHVVVAHTTPTSAKVKCEVCGSQKTYKLPKAPAKKKTVTRTGRTTRSKSDPGLVWNELLEKIGTDNVQPYNMRMKFSLQSAINHPKFGIGFITLVTAEKIEVTFQEGGRSLVHNRG